MVITITSLKLRSLFGFFALSWNGLKITLQARKSSGFVTMKNTGAGYLHYTASAWKTAEEARAFAHSGAHLLAMKGASRLAAEVRIYTYEGDKIPSWSEAKKLVHAKGRVYSYSKPAPL